MKETYEFRIYEDYYHLLPHPNNARFNGAVYVLKISRDNIIFHKLKEINKKVKEKFGKSIFGFWNVKRSYTKKELVEAKLFHFKIKTTFEPTGEECGTLYDETFTCKICGANKKQISSLILKKGSIPKKDIARTIGGEIVVSDRFVNAIKQRKMKGLALTPVNFEKQPSTYYQLTANMEVDLSHRTVAGVNAFDFSESSEGTDFTIQGGYHIKFEKEIYKCYKGHTIGLNILSEPYVLNSPLIKGFDFFVSKQKIGVKRGLLSPEPVYICSPALKKMVKEEKLSGFEFEIAHID